MEGYNASNRLYYCGVKNKNLRDLEYSKIGRLRNELEEEGLSFTPKINQVSQMLSDARSERYKATHDRLIDAGKASEKKKEIFREMRQQIESSICKFKPSIDPMYTEVILEAKESTQKKEES